MADWLDAPRRRLEHARRHTKTLSNEVQRFIQTNPYRLWREFDAHTGHEAVGIERTDDPPTILSLIVGDVLHNMRSALDHFLWQLTITNGHKPPPFPLSKTPEGRRWRALQFPLYLDESAFDAARKSNDPLWGVTPNAVAFITDEQPFRAGKNNPAVHPLAILAELSNIDKHRTGHLTASYLQYLRAVSSPLAGGGTVSFVSGRGPGIFRADETLVTLKLDPPQPDLDYETEVELNVAFDWSSPAVAGEPIVPALGRVGSYIHELFKRADAGL